MSPLPRVPGYELLQLLGGGPLTHVFKARRGETDQLCAVKLLRDEWELHPTAIKLLRREALALLAILSNAAELGSDTGLARMVPRYRALGRTQDLRRLVAAAVVPVFVIGAILGGLMFALAPHLAHAFIHQANRHDVRL